jgi:plasmid stabilization system protein ParE
VAAYLAAGDPSSAEAVARGLRTAADASGDPPLHRAVHHEIEAMIALATGDHSAVAVAAHGLVAAATEHGYVLLQIDGLELLALSSARPATTAAVLVGAAAAARDRIGYRGRWLHLTADVIAVTEAAQRHNPTDYSRGTHLALAEASALAALT